MRSDNPAFRAHVKLRVDEIVVVDDRIALPFSFTEVCVKGVSWPVTICVHTLESGSSAVANEPMPPSVSEVIARSRGRKWKQLARERIEDVIPTYKTLDSSASVYRVMAGLEPAICRRTVLEEVAGSSLATT